MKVEWVILADAAQISSWKLFLLGGAWDILTVNDQFPHRQHVGVAASFMVPWNETNEPHDVYVAIVADNDASEVMRIDARVEVGRPAGILPGQEQRALMAAEAIVELNEGTYFVAAGIGGTEGARVPFRVVAGPALRR